MGPERQNRNYEVGTKVFSFTDESREERLGDGIGKRRIAVRLYYPVNKDDVNGLKKAVYVSENKWECMRKAYHVPRSAGGIEEVELYEDAPMAGTEKFPLVLYNHGYGAYMESNTFLCMELAASGYIVASVGHSYESFCTEYEDGSFAPIDKKINKMMYKKGVLRAVLAQGKLIRKKGSPEEIYEEFLKFENEHTPYIVDRLKDWSEDTLCALKEIKVRYADRLDLSGGVAATGHSMGGAVAYYLCHTSEEISCGLNIDGGLFGDYQNSMLTKPFFQISCKESWNAAVGVLLHKTAPVYCALFEHMKHIGYTDAKFFVPLSMVVGKMAPQKMHNYLTQYHIRFLDKYLKGHEVAEIAPEDREIRIIRSLS